MSTVPKRIEYPESDGKPVAETPLHRDILLGLVETLKQYFAHDPTIYVSGNMMVYYVEGDPRKSVAPDVWMARGVPDRQRRTFLIWEEPRGPEMVIEVSSRKTRRQDLVQKFELYRDVMDVREYFLFDPEADYLKPPLQGFRLVEGRYVPIEPDAHNRLRSEVAGLHLERDGSVLRLFDPATGAWVPWTFDLRDLVERERRRAEDEHRRAQDEHRRAEDEHRRAEDEHRRAQDERRRAEIAQKRLDEALRELEALRRRTGAEGENPPST